MHILDNLKVSGVYFIKNRENGCVYIGCSEPPNPPTPDEETHCHEPQRSTHHRS